MRSSTKYKRRQQTNSAFCQASQTTQAIFEGLCSTVHLKVGTINKYNQQFTTQYSLTWMFIAKFLVYRCAGGMLIWSPLPLLLCLFLLFLLWTDTQGRCPSCPSNACSQTGMAQGQALLKMISLKIYELGCCVTCLTVNFEWIQYLDNLVVGYLVIV